MPYTPDTIKAILSRGESRTVEFKASLRDAATLAKTISGFGNTEGGVLLIGVGPNGEVIGADSAHIGRLFHGALATIVNAPRVDLEATELDGKQVVVVTVGRAGRLVSTTEGIFTRTNRTETPMSASEVAGAIAQIEPRDAPATHTTTGIGGWARVDRQANRAQAALITATSEEDFQTVGLLCREAIISLAQAVYDPSKHLSIDGVKPSETDAARMLDAFMSAEFPGGANEELRRHAKAALALAISLQHKRTADYLHAALTLEAVKAVINVVALVSGRQSLPSRSSVVEPFRIPRMNDPELERISAHYRQLQREPVLPRFEERDVNLARGYEIARYPGTGREVWVGHHEGRYEHLLMLKPVTDNSAV